MRAFHADPTIKALYLARVRRHRAADELERGVYYTKYTGGRMRMCAVGCTIHGSDHAAYERELGIPRTIARIEDAIFEGMSEPDAQEWPERFLEIIPVGADLSMVAPRLMLWLLDEEGYNVGQYATTHGKQTIEHVANLYRRLLAGEDVPIREWVEAGATTYADANEAACVTAAACASATLGLAIYTAAEAAAGAVEAAAEATTEAINIAVDFSMEASDASVSAAWEHAYSRIADELVRLLGAAPVPARPRQLQEVGVA